MNTSSADRTDSIQHWTVGDTTVHRIDESPLPPTTGAWLPGRHHGYCQAAGLAVPDFADHEGVLHLDSHSFAFVLDGLRILVDTGIGNGKERANPAWHNLKTDYLARLTAAGFPRTPSIGSSSPTCTPTTSAGTRGK